jgi:hypothetical protein
MADNTDLRGIWTYRSFANTPGIVGDFSKLEVWEAELSLEVGQGGRVHGLLGERPETATGAEPYLFLEGEVVPGNPTTIRWRAKGRPQSEYDGWIYDYIGYLAPDWLDATHPRPAIIGTVTRTVAHGTAPAGSVFSFIAVKSDFLEPRIVIPLAKPVVDMIASAEHRHHHALWHASRDEWANLSDAKKDALRALGWQPGPNGKERASLSRDRFTNGSGEDFFFMHRRMVRDVRGMDPSVGTWTRLPLPQFPSSFAAGTKSSHIGNLNGYAVPPAWIVPGDPDTTSWLVELRKPSTLYEKFQAWEMLYTDPPYLASLSLGELGSRIEFTIHNWMHMRWASITLDPSSDKTERGLPLPAGRAPLDFDSKWVDPDYDYLGETFSSHVNPIFWRLHGWVNDRIDDWYGAQEAARPGTVKRKQLYGIDWFESDGRWVLSEEPWEGLRAEQGSDHHEHGDHSDHGHDHGGLSLDVPTMRKALTIIFGPEPTAAPAAFAERVVQAQRPQGTWFKRIDI